MKKKNYLEMMKEATTSAEAHAILNEVSDELELYLKGEYDDNEYYEMLLKVEPYYHEHLDEFFTSREVNSMFID